MECNYHFNFIYNSQELQETTDNRLATRFVYYLDEKISGWGRKCYIKERDCIGGSNIFDELFRIVSETDKCIVIITPEFRTNYWAKYCKQAAFKYLMDKTNQHKMIPITLNITNISSMSELLVNDPFHIKGSNEEEWENNNRGCLERLKKTLTGNEVPHVAEDSNLITMADDLSGRMKLSIEEREIIEVLRSAGDKLDNDPRIKRIITEVATGSLAGLPYTVFTQLIRDFIALVVGSTVVSAKMVEKIVRIFIKMWGGPELSDKVLQELYPGSSVDDIADIYIPQEVSLMDDDFIKKYQEVLKHGKQNVKSIRLMVVGMFGIGKTSLVENLVERDDSSDNKKIGSTVGIDVTHCKIRDGKWIEDIFDNNLSDRFLEVMHNPDMPALSVDDVDSSTMSLASCVDMKSENDVTEEILYRRNNLEEEIKNIDQPPIKDSDKEVQEDVIQSVNDDKELFTTSEFANAIKSAEKPQSKLDSTISIWDFAGQYIYYSTHHFFLNPRSIYFLMMDISIPLQSKVKEESDFPLSGLIPKDFTCLEAFKFWLNSIHMYSTPFGADDKPSVILVGTNKDKLQGTDEEKERFKDQYFDEALKSFDFKSPALKHVSRKKFLINNLDKNDDFWKIRTEVECLAKTQRYWGEARPAKWILLERKFLGLKSEGKEIITFEDVKKVDSEIEMPIVDEKELRLFLMFQHLLGNILYYETPLLKDYVILSPQWIIDAFRCFITHVKDKHPQELEDWDNYEKKAILTQSLIDEILDHTEENKYFRDYKKLVIEYMEHLDMIARPIDTAICEVEGTKMSAWVNKEKHSNENACDNQKLETVQPVMTHSVDQPIASAEKKSSSPVNFFIVPSLLKLRPELNEKAELINPQDCETKTPVLCFKFINKFMPPSVFHRLLAVCIRKWTVVIKKKCPLLYNGFARFYVSGTATLSIWFQDYIIYARVSFYDEDELDRSLAQEIRLFLASHLNEILRILPNESRISGEMPFEEYIQCPGVDCNADSGLIRLSKLMLNGKSMCKNCVKAVKKDELIAMWCYTSLQKKNASDIPADLLEKQPTAQQLARVTKAIGRKYLSLKNVLGLDQAMIDQAEDFNRFHLSTRIYHILYKWNTEDKTIEQLRDAVIAIDADIDTFDSIIQNDPFESIKLDNLEGVDYSRKPSDEEIASLAQKIGHEYWLVGVELGISEVKLEQISADNVTIALRVYYMLREWNEGDSSIEYLGKAMCLVKPEIRKAFYEVFTK